MTEPQELITYDELNEALEKDTVHSDFKTAGNFVIDALIDWPTEDQVEISDFVAELKHAVNGKLTLDSLQRYLESLDEETEDNAWKMTSIESLIDLLHWETETNGEATADLEIILKRLTEHYRSNG